MQAEREKCHSAVADDTWDERPCNKPAKFRVTYLFETWPVCGIHARRFKNRYGATLKPLPTGVSDG